MKRFYYTILICLLGLFVADRAGGYALSVIGEHSNIEFNQKMNTMMHGNNDFLLMGTSRCHHHYVSQMMIDSLGVDLYNAGIKKSGNIYSFYFELCLLLKYHVPKVILLDLYVQDLYYHDINYLNQFGPYLGIDDEADEFFAQVNEDYPLHQASHLYRHNSHVLAKTLGVFYTNYHDDHGYSPAQAASGPIKLQVDTTRYTPEKSRVDAIEKFILKCKEKNIKLILSISPELYIRNEYHYDPIVALARKYDLPLIQNQRLLIDYPNYFRDNFHLCHNGAVVFTEKLITQLKPLLKY